MGRYDKVKLRDIEALAHLYKHRYLTGKLFKHLPLSEGYFPSQQVANRRIKRLIDEGLVKEFSVTGVSSRILRIRKKALPWVAGLLDCEEDDLEWNPQQKEPKGYIFLRHFLLNNKFRIAIERACNGSEIELVDYIPEHIGKRHESGRITEMLSDRVSDEVLDRGSIHHTPDGVFALERNGKTELFFVEIDRGTERQYRKPDRPYFKMIRFYLSYLRTGQFRSYNEVFNALFKRFRVLVVTTSEERMNNMRESMTILPGNFAMEKKFIWFSVFNEDSDLDEFSDSFFSNQWRSLDVQDENQYTIG